MNFRFIALSIVTAAITSVPASAQGGSALGLRIGIQSENTKRNSSLSDVVTPGTSASLQAIEGVLSPADGGAGIGGRLIQGTMDGRDFLLREGRLFVGPLYFHVEGAYGERSVSGTDSMATFARAGLKSIVQIGGSGVAVILSGSKYFEPRFTKKKTTDGISEPVPDGWEAETSLYYTAPRVPVFARVGYKTEYFSFGNREENLHSVIIGTGLWIGAR